MTKKKKVKIVAIGLACILFVVVICVYASPRSRVSLFVHSYHQLIEESLAVGHGVPADDAVLFGYKYVNSWDAEHPMTEFVIMSRGDTYYGCYYSPDDVPLVVTDNLGRTEQYADSMNVQDGKLLRKPAAAPVVPVG